MRLIPLLRTGLLIALIFGAVWFAVIAYWRLAEVDPGGGDLAVFLLGLPIALLGAGWGVNRMIARRRAETATSTPAASVSETVTAEADPELRFTLPLLGSALRLPLGTDARHVAAALAEGASPRLHPHLQDERGRPRRVSQVPEVDTRDIAEALQSLMQAGQSFKTLFPIERLRALALATPVLKQLVQTARDVPPPPTENDAAPAVTIPLRATLLLPTNWPDAARGTVNTWFLQCIEDAGWPAHLTAEVLALSGPAEGLALLDDLIVTLNRPLAPSLHLVLACDSLIGEDSSGSTAGRLLNTEDLVPGEGAAGLLLASTNLQILDATPVAQLHRLAQDRRGASADRGGRVSTQTVEALLERALAIANQSADKVAGVVSDADQRRASEIATAVSAKLKTLDPVGQCWNLEAACGHCGSVTPLAMLAVAARRVSQTQAPMVAVSLTDSYVRAALVIAPPPSPDEPKEVVAAAA